jgi:murein DD-endopeptidase MepM/ murein hydrolase activator NlpD
LKAKKTLSNWLTERYLLIIRNEENFAEKRFLGFTYAKFFLISAVVFLALMIASLFLTRTILAQWFDPNYAQMEANKQLYKLTLRLDSLAEEVRRKDQFIALFGGFLTGETDSTMIDNFIAGRQVPNNAFEIDFTTTPIDSQIRQEFEAEEAAVNLGITQTVEIQEVFFFSPISGLVSRKFSLKDDHYGVDVVAKKNEPVMAVASGTVIISSWTQDSGYVLAIQHSSNLISIYKHNAELLKKTGSFVNGAEVIAIIGNTGELTDGPHLHFELWYNGNPVNPEDFVSF